MFYLCGTGSAQLSIAFLNNFFPTWHSYLAIYTVGLSVAALLAPFVLREDPVYLYNNGQMDDLYALVEGVGVMNGATVQQMQAASNELSRINKNRGKRVPQMAELIPNNILNKTVLTMMGVMICCSFTTNSVYFGIGFQIDKFGLSVTSNLLIFGTV